MVRQHRDSLSIQSKRYMIVIREQLASCSMKLERVSQQSKLPNRPTLNEGTSCFYLLSS